MQIEPAMFQQLLAIEGAQAAAPAPPADQSRRLAVVFALLVPRDEINLLFIRRADLGDPWSGQIAFPGGHVESTDADPLATGYRELAEEVGIRPDAVTCLGDLGHFPTQTTRVLVRAFVGLWDGRQAAQADAAEVAGICEVPVSHLLDHHRREGFDVLPVEQIGRRLVYPLTPSALAAIAKPDATIWGVTARILHHLLGLIAKLPPGKDEG
ncbi:MAG TPA: CoA pyrophosphatase [Phycisphaerae bacterium]|nr:CoA pyrophosphatase [Phycisphaerae bacterium]